MHNGPGQIVVGRIVFSSGDDTEQSGVVVVCVERREGVAQLIGRHRAGQPCTSPGAYDSCTAESHNC